MSRRGIRIVPSCQRRIARTVAVATMYRSPVNTSGGTSPMAPLTMTKLAAQHRTTRRTPSSATRRSEAWSRAADGSGLPEDVGPVGTRGRYVLERQHGLCTPCARRRPADVWAAGLRTRTDKTDDELSCVGRLAQPVSGAWL